MTSIRQLNTPIERRSCHSMSNHTNPAISSVKTTPSYEGHSSESETKKNLPGAKRRPSRAGTRSVTTLTAAQLERKRANDREAQRAIRQRTKDHIESLERRIAELTANQSAGASGRLNEIIQRNEELEQENAVLRQRLNHAISSLGSGGYAENTALPNDNNILASSGAPSPSDRISMLNRTSSTPSARSVPAVSATSAPNVSTQADQWSHPHPNAHPAYSPAGNSSGPEANQPVDVSAGSDGMRWSPHGHHVPAPVSVTGGNMHPVDSAVQSPIGYGYVLDSTGRPLPYQSEPQNQQMSYSHIPVSNAPPPPPPSYHEQRHIVHMPPSAQSSYSHYPQPPSYIPSSAHHGGESMPLMQRGHMENQHMMYSIPSNVKPEQ